MTSGPMTLSPDDDLEEAVQLLIDEKIGGVPVVDETGRVGRDCHLRRSACAIFSTGCGKTRNEKRRNRNEERQKKEW